MDNGSFSALTGYDLEVTDSSSGTVIETLEVKEPYARITGLANGTAYAVKVRAKTAFGTSPWESASITPKTVPAPPPAGSGTCTLEVSDPAGSANARSTTESAVQEYVDRVEAYYQAQDTVLEGRVTHIWDAPGVTALSPSTAKLSVHNQELIEARAAIVESGEPNRTSTVTAEGTVIWYGPEKCPSKVDIDATAKINLRSPRMQQTPKGPWVMTVINDGCSAPVVGNEPMKGVNFKVACDSHDYGYGLIRSGYLPQSKRNAVDCAFRTIMRDMICAAKPYNPLGNSPRAECNKWAAIFVAAVKSFGGNHIGPVTPPKH